MMRAQQRPRVEKLLTRKADHGYSLPLILLVVIVTIGLLAGLLRTAIGNNFNTRIRLFTALGYSALDSIVNQYRSILNDETYNNPFNQFWLVQGCSNFSPGMLGLCPVDIATKGRISPSGIQDPSQTYWEDEEFCTNWPEMGKKGCIGRQISPTCTYDNPNLTYRATSAKIDWGFYRGKVNSYFNTRRDLSETIATGGSFRQQGNIATYKTVGQIERFGGRGTLDVSGYTTGANNKIRSERKAKVLMEIGRYAPYSGFAYISAGMRQADKNTIHLANLATISPSYDLNMGPSSAPTGVGTVLLRRNMSNWSTLERDYYPRNCSDLQQIFFYEHSNVGATSGGSYRFPRTPDASPMEQVNGGLLVHSPYLPEHVDLKTPALANAQTLIVRKKRMECLRADGRTLRTYEYKNLFILRGAIYCVESSDKSKVMIKIADSLDVAPGGRFCHVAPGSTVCGSGKPENLTLLSIFDDLSAAPGLESPVSSDSGCSVPRGGAGTGESYASRDPRGRPGPSFTFRNTGSVDLNTGMSNEMVSAFIYGKSLTFNSSGVPRHGITDVYSDELDLLTSSDLSVSSGSLVIHRSRLSATALDGINDGTVWKLLYPNGQVAILGDHTRGTVGSDGGFSNEIRQQMNMSAIVAIAKRTDLGAVYNIDPYIYVTQQRNSNILSVYKFNKLNNPLPGATNGEINLTRIPMRSVLTPLGRIQASFSISDTMQRNLFKQMYGITLRGCGYSQCDISNAQRVYKGAVWAEKVCFSRNYMYGDYLREHYWIFDPKFVDGLAKRYGDQFRWGYSRYKSQRVNAFDMLRNLFN